MEWCDCASSNLARFARDGEDLVVEFKSGGQFRYSGAGPLFEDMQEADSKGKFFHSQIRGSFDSARVEQEGA